MGRSDAEDTPVRARVTIDAESAGELNVGWLDRVRLPQAARVDYRDVGSRGDFVVTHGGNDIAAVCDLISGEFVASEPLGVGDPSAELLLRLLGSRLRHVDRASEARLGREGALRPLARLTGGAWYPYERLLGY